MLRSAGLAVATLLLMSGCAAATVITDVGMVCSPAPACVDPGMFGTLGT